MTTTIPTLASLDYIPYLDDSGQIPTHVDRMIGVYAIFDQNKILQYVGYSRDVALSLKQHLVRQPQNCYWFKVQSIDRPSRPMLEGIRDVWIAENGSTPSGNGDEEPMWSQAIDVRPVMTPEEQAAYAASDEAGKIKTLKKVARRVEEEVLAALEVRGVTMPIRFDPKAKEEGLLTLK